MTGKVFISYRRDDSAGHAGRVHDRLAHEFGQDLLFMDVDAIPLGVNFVKVLDEAVGKCDVLIAVIGPNWAEIKDEQGLRRLDSPNDFVRVEIGAALRRDIPVIPVLLDGTAVPNASRLPEEIRELSLRNGLDVRHSSFHADMDKLVRFLKTRVSSQSAPQIATAAPGVRPAPTKETNGKEPSKTRGYVFAAAYVVVSTFLIGVVLIGLGFIPLLEKKEFYVVFFLNLIIAGLTLRVWRK